MALDLSKLNFFNKLDARARVGVLFVGLLAAIFLVYLATRYFAGGSSAIGPSSVASAPAGLQSVPGGTTQTAEYTQALMQANDQRAEAAKMSGSSAIPTQFNTAIASMGGSSGCVICTEQTPNVAATLDDWVKQGKITPDVATQLKDLANKNASVEDYAQALNKMVQDGKLTPEQARILLDQYKKQHGAALVNDSAKTMDALIKSGQLPLDAANQLLDAQKKEVSPSEYAKMLQQMVKDGKITPDVAQKLLAQYAQQYTKQVISRSVAALQQMATNGEITPEVLNALIDLENQMVPIDLVSDNLKKWVGAGKLTPAASDKILAEYKDQKSQIGPNGSVDELIRQAEAAAFLEISQLLRDKLITPETGAKLSEMIQNNIPLEEYTAAVHQMVQNKQLTPEIAKLKIGDYTQVKTLRDMKAQLFQLQANNASPQAYADALKKAVLTGVITPDQAAELLQQYQASGGPGLSNLASGASAANFAQALQQQGGPSGQYGTGQFAPGSAEAEAAAAQQQAANDQERANRLQAMLGAMSSQSGQLIAAWGPVTMVHRGGPNENPAGGNAKDCGDCATGTTTKTQTANKNTLDDSSSGAPLIKAGSIIFAVLDTAVNSDYPDSPVLATIVQGPYKGAKLLGKLTTAKSVSGQLDRISLNFSLMNLDNWPKSRTVTAYAIDPDTARSVMASSVDYHYAQKFGAIMATSFIQGYANAISSSGSNTTTGIFGTSTTHPELSPGQKLAMAVGQIGQNLGSVTQNYTNIAPTVRVDSGVSLGILFMADVT